MYITYKDNKGDKMKLTKDNLEKLALIDEIRQAVKDTISQFNLVYYRKPLGMDFIYENGKNTIADEVIQKTSLFETKEKERIIERDKYIKV